MILMNISKKCRSNEAILNPNQINKTSCLLVLSPVSNEIERVKELSKPDLYLKHHTPSYSPSKRIGLTQNNPTLAFLKSRDLAILSFAIPDIENWLKANQNNLALAYSSTWIFELFETYIESCDKYYQNDQLGISRMLFSFWMKFRKSLQSENFTLREKKACKLSVELL